MVIVVPREHSELELLVLYYLFPVRDVAPAIFSAGPGS